MFLNIITQISIFYQKFFLPFDSLIKKLPFGEWAIDAIIDTIHLAPFLFLIFVVIELIEKLYSQKILNLLKNANKFGVIVGSFASLLPQCGFSVIASSLYSRGFITKGILIAVFLTTSDETIPILLANPSKMYLIIPIVLVKLFVGIVFGYLIDLLMPTKILPKKEIIIEKGCCKHNLSKVQKYELIYHPICHTINILAFILVVTLILNYSFIHFDLSALISNGKLIQPIITSLLGLIPNCAVSVGLTILLMKGTITFGSAIAGLLSNAGLGLLVLLKNNDIKDTSKIIFLLFLISSLSGIVINCFYF